MCIGGSITLTPIFGIISQYIELPTRKSLTLAVNCPTPNNQWAVDTRLEKVEISNHFRNDIYCDALKKIDLSTYPVTFRESVLSPFS